MKWNAYYYSYNENQMKSFNIFDHWKFREDVENDLSTYINRDEFARALRSHLFYYFCSKCEWEILISPWGSHREPDPTKKIDVFDQVTQNFDQFLDYIWSKRGE